MKYRAVLASLFVLLTCSLVSADVRMPTILSDGMVLQRGRPIPVWGWAEPNESVTVAMGGQSQSTVADGNGTWSLELSEMPAGGPYVMTIKGKNTLELSDVLVGDVWLCAGQSNMQRGLNLTEAGRRSIAHADHPRIRLLTLDRVVADEPVEDAKLLTTWTPCDSEAARNFSAVGYHFGVTLQGELDIPVGLINCSWGGTRAEAWTSEQALRGDPALESIFKRASKIRASADLAKQRHHLPASIYNSMIAPLVRYPLAGVIWYQGESNEPWPNEYRALLPTLIADWRSQWGQVDLPFGIVQLAAYRRKQISPAEESKWAVIREVQWLTSEADDYTGMAVTIDIGDENNIHPANKRDVGYRLALWALTDVYAHAFIKSGPTLRSMEITNGQAVLTFDNTGGGLVARGSGELRGFAVAGADQRFVWAEASCDGDRVIVQSEDVPNVLAVRYGWSDNPIGNLFSVNGLPATPFRTDDWPVIEDQP